MKVVLLDRLRRCTPPAIRLWMTQGWLRMSPGVRLHGGGRCGQRLTSGLPKPTTAPCGSLTQLAARSGTSAGTHPRFSWVHPLAQPRGNLGFPDDPSAQRRRVIAPKNIATFNAYSEALEPMAGALWTSYDASFPAHRRRR